MVLIGDHGQVVYRAAFGALSLVPEPAPMRPDAIFDLASLTKVIATTTAIMQLVEAHRISLDQPVATDWPAFGGNGKAAITVRQLLTHTSGLRPDLDTTRAWSGQDAALDRVVAERPVHPPGTRFVYSDINFIVLGELVHRISGQPLDVYAATHIFAPLHMRDTGFHPPASNHIVSDRIVPTERQAGVPRRGQVQDPTAYRMGGVAGHAGLFSTADDLAKFAEALVDPAAASPILRPETIATMVTPTELPGGARRGLGWDSASAYASGMDLAFGPRSFGHTGYTGTLVWIDPVRQGFLILLTSRLHPDGRGDAVPLRRQIARALTPAPTKIAADVGR